MTESTDMESEIQKCEKCSNDRKPINEYEFYYGCTYSWPPGRVPFDKSNAYRPGRVQYRLEGSKKRWICDGCILRKRIWSLMLAIGMAVPICLATGALLYYCVKPIDSALKEWPMPFLTMPCCAMPLVMLGGIIVLTFLILPLGPVLYCFQKKEEIGASIAIEVEKKTPEEIKLMLDLKKWNEDVEAGNLASGLVLNPRRLRSFWTPREKESKHFLNQ